MHRATTIIRLTLLLLLASIISCSKENASSPAGSSSQGVLNSGILAKLPASTLGFIAWNTEIPAYNRFRASSWSQSGALQTAIDSLKTQNDQNLQPLRSLLEILQESGLTAHSKQDQEPISEGTIFLEYSPANILPSLSIYLQSRQVNLGEKLEKIHTSLQNRGLVSSKQSIQGTAGLVVSIPDTQGKEQIIDKIYLAATKERMAISTAESNIGNLFSTNGSSAFQEIKASAEFKKSTEKLAINDSLFCFGFLSVQRILSSLATSPLIAATGASLTEIKDIPLTAIAMARSMTETPSDEVAVALDPKTDRQKEWITQSTSAKQGDLLNRAPADLLFLLTIDGGIIANAKQDLLSAMPAQSSITAYEDMLSATDSLRTIGIAAREGSGGTPFPEILIGIQSSDTATWSEIIQKRIKETISSSGLPFTGWQEKEIAGSKVSYVLTPLGIGLFMGSAKDSIFIASSESILSAFMAAGRSQGKTLSTALSLQTKKLLQDPLPLLAVYTNLEGIANMLSSLQGTLAMFTGGQPNSSAQNKAIEDLKKFGRITIAVDQSNGIVRIRSSYEKSASAPS